MCINLMINRVGCRVISSITRAARCFPNTAIDAAIAVTDAVSLNTVWLLGSSTATACTRSWLLLCTCYEGGFWCLWLPITCELLVSMICGNRGFRGCCCCCSTEAC